MHANIYIEFYYVQEGGIPERVDCQSSPEQKTNNKPFSFCAHWASRHMTIESALSYTVRGWWSWLNTKSRVFSFRKINAVGGKRTKAEASGYCLLELGVCLYIHFHGYSGYNSWKIEIMLKFSSHRGHVYCRLLTCLWWTPPSCLRGTLWCLILRNHEIHVYLDCTWSSAFQNLLRQQKKVFSIRIRDRKVHGRAQQEEKVDKMRWLQLLPRTRQLFWRSARRRKATATSEASEGQELPNGFLFNEKVGILFYLVRTILIFSHSFLLYVQPLLPGEKRQKESWENLWVYGMGFNFLFMIAVIVLKPDTRWVKTWTCVSIHCTIIIQVY